MTDMKLKDIAARIQAHMERMEREGMKRDLDGYGVRPVYVKPVAMVRGSRLIVAFQGNDIAGRSDFRAVSFAPFESYDRVQAAELLAGLDDGCEYASWRSARLHLDRQQEIREASRIPQQIAAAQSQQITPAAIALRG